VATVVETLAENFEPRFEVGIELASVEAEMQPALDALIAHHPETESGSDEIN